MIPGFEDEAQSWAGSHALDTALMQDLGRSRAVKEGVDGLWILEMMIYWN